MLSQDQAAAIATLMGASGTIFLAIRKITKWFKAFFDEQVRISDHLKIIKQEVTPNGGGSMKDIINNLKSTVDRIEIRQKILDQRSKATLHYSSQCLFETDKDGRLTWHNEAFKTETLDLGPLEGHDWFSVVDEKQREEFITEIKSCLIMCRKIDIETVSVNGCSIRFVGFPYKVAHSIHEGFLIHFFQIGECNEHRRF
jgi:hypothetical protein